jgi:tripartite-type tricarboxylate transporter receptor subunit TctC
MKRLMHACLAVLAATVAFCAIAQEWPSRPVKVVVPSSPGGGTDIYARLIAAALSESLGQQFVIDNRPGGAGNIGTEIVVRAAPDGYTLLVSSSASVIINPALFPKLPWNVERDLAPVSAGVRSPMVFCVHPSSPLKTVADLVNLGTKEPGTVSYGSAGIGTTTSMGVRMLEERSGARFLHVPYKGIGPASQALIAGQIQFLLPDLPAVMAQLKAGKLRALALTDPVPQLPGVPTMEQQGYPNFEVAAAFSMMAPAGTPPAIIRKLNTEIAAAMKSPPIAAKLNALIYIPVFETPEEYGARLKRVRAMWADFVRRNHITAEQQ